MSVLVFVEGADDLSLQALAFARRYDPDVEMVAFGTAPPLAGVVHLAELDAYAPQA
jgi:hypothetical protein